MKCYDCRYATEYPCWYWFPWFDPRCSKGHQIGYEDCEDFEQIGRLSR